MKLTLPIKILIIALVTIFCILLLAYSVIGIIFLGPSKDASRILVSTLMETSAAKFVPKLYMSQAKIDEIMAYEEALAENLEIDVNLIKLPSAEAEDKQNSDPDFETSGEINNNEQIPESSTPTEDTTPAPEQGETLPPEPINESGIEIHDVKSSNYNGKMMIIKDPTRVFVGVPEAGFGQGKKGMTVFEMIEHYGAVAGTNAGGFYDPNGSGSGGIPEGIVIYNGEILWDDGKAASIAGFDENGILYVGSMTAKAAKNKGIKYAASYGPALIMNGEPISQSARGYQPRTAIGQRADGAILLLVINGRSVSSLGATIEDLIEIFIRYEAVNATNLDGGSSSIMIHEGQYLTDSAYIFGERVVPTSILIK